jgi:hypothetical protein
MYVIHFHKLCQKSKSNITKMHSRVIELDLYCKVFVVGRKSGNYKLYKPSLHRSD